MSGTTGDAGADVPARAWADFDLDALRANLREIERRVGDDVEVIASVKADAYGHGAVPVARALESAGVLALATGSLSEAVAIRQERIESPILLFPGFLADAVPAILAHRLMPAVERLELARELDARATRSVPVWVKVDAGLGRHGVALDDAVALVEALGALARVELEGVFTHLPFVDEAGRGWAEERLAEFAALLRALEGRGLGPRHSQALSSAGALAGLADPCSAICPGHALYGIAPVASAVASTAGLEPVARSITTRLAHVATHPRERSMGVGGARVLPAGSVTGVVSLGRRDGYRWHADQEAAMLVAGRRAPVIGLSLEHVMLDLTGITGAATGDEAVVLGEQGGASIELGELAAWRRSSPVETLLDFAGRIEARYQST